MTEFTLSEEISTLNYERNGRMRSYQKRLLLLSIVLVFAAVFYSMSACERAYAAKPDDGTTSGSGYENWDSTDSSTTDTGNAGSGKPWKSFGNDDIDETQHFLGTTNDNDIVIKTNNTEKARITSEGNVGIGTDTPTGTLHVEGGRAAGTTDDGTDITIKAQDGGIVSGAGGNIVLAPGTGIMTDEFGNPIPSTDEFGNPILDEFGNPVPVTKNGEVIVKGNIAPASDDVNSVGTPDLRYKDIYLASNIHYQDDGLFFMFDFWNARDGAWVSLERGVFTWDGKFGIGTVEPTEELHVIGDVLATGNIDAVSYTGDGSALTGTSATDTALQNNIDAEETARLAAVAASDGAIATNAGNITQEIADRIADVNAEETARLAAVAASDGAIATNAGNITQEIADRIADVDAEETDRLAAVAASDGAIATNAGNITQEIADRKTADGLLQDNIDTEKSERESTDSVNSGAITANTAAITSEASVRSATDISLQASIDADNDADPVNEIQTLSKTDNDITLTNGGGTVSVADSDNDSSNELNTGATLSGTNLELTDAGGTLSVDLSGIAGSNGPTSFFEVYLGGAQSMGGAFVKFNWRIEDSDTNNEFDLNTDRFTVKVAGIYMFQAVAAIASTQTRDSQLQLRKNNTPIADVISTPSHNWASSTNTISIMVNANVGDYFDVWGQVNSGHTQGALTGKQYTYFKGYRLK